MIEVDISNIWGRVSLPDLLRLEAQVAAAHEALTDTLELPPEETVQQILAAAEQIRAQSDVLVVLGSCLGAQAALELLGSNGVRILFAGSHFSTHQWNGLMQQLEGKDFSLWVGDASLEAAVAFRALRWMLERKHGTDEARQRLFAPVMENPWDEGWQALPLSGDAGALVPMAAAGLDIRAFLDGIRDSREAYSLRSYENPVWLHAGVRQMLRCSGKAVEVLTALEPDLDALGHWWQAFFGTCPGPFPVWGQPRHFDREDWFATVLHFDRQEPSMVIGQNVKDLEGINALAGKTLEQVRQQAFSAALDTWSDRGVPVLRVDCGSLHEKTLGSLYAFFRLSCCLCRQMGL